MILSKEEISYFREYSNLITHNLLEELRNQGNQGKDIQLELLDMPKDSEQYYIDQFENRISFNGNRGLKASHTQHNLHTIHLEEIQRCQDDIHYFKDNYIKIVTPQGVTFPTVRNYQNDFLTTVSGDQQDVVQLMPRQCVQGDTKITLKCKYGFKEIQIKELFEYVREDSKGWNPINLQSKNTELFKESYLQKGIQVFTDTGFKDIIEVHKTIPLKKLKIRLSNNLTIECQPHHVFITETGNEIHQEDSLGKFIKTQSGDQLVQLIEDCEVLEEMYDVSINSKDELYYTNGILSHNSGKSVSTQMYLAWVYVFMKNINIGIVQNRGSAAREFLDKTKQIIINLPIWMQPGTDVWNKMSIRSDSGVKMLTDVPSSDSFRGDSIHCLSGDTEIHIFDISIKEERCENIKWLYDSCDHSILEDFRKNNLFLIRTPNGFQNFEGVKRTLSKGIKIYFEDETAIECTLQHLFKNGEDFIEARDLSVGDLIQNKVIQKITQTEEKYFYDPVEVEGDHTYIQQGMVHHNCLVVDETQFIRTTVFEEFQDSIFPSQSGLAWKKNILLSTQNGQNHFYDIVQGARQGTNGYIPFEVDWKDTPRFKSDGSQYLPEEFKRDIVQKHGDIHFNQNYACQFLGSSQTLLNQETLGSLKSREPEYVRDGMLRVYKDPKAGEKYILTVDAQKDGSDYFTVNIFSISTFPFEQVQSQKLQINYLLMPDYILEWQESYNYQYVIIENNEGQGQSIQDVLYTEYEYENMHFDVNTNTKIRRKKEHPGFRTNRANRPILLSTMQSFLEEGKLVIHDKDLIEEFKHFILINGKYQADDGYHDDLVMGTSFLFVPFIDLKNFDGYRDVIDALYDKDTDQNFDFMDSIVFGSFDQDAEDDSKNYYDPEIGDEFDLIGFGPD